MGSETFIEAAGRRVRISSPEKPWFPGLCKLDVVRYWEAVAEPALRGIAGRPMQMERFPKGLDGPPFYQKRLPKGAPDWIEFATLRYASRRTADEVVVRDLAQLLWVVNLGCFTLHPHPVRAADLDHPDELRIDLDPVRGVPWSEVQAVAAEARAVLDEHGLISWPKTSGKRGLHLWVRIEPVWTFEQVRQAAIGVAREVAHRLPGRATAAWWKEQRTGVFLDYNQNAPDRTTAAAWSVRPTADARVSMPLHWDEVASCDPAAFTVRTAPARYAAIGDPHAGIDDAVCDLTGLLELADRHPAPVRVEKPLLTIGESEDEGRALDGLERWKARYPEVAALLAPHHVLVDKNRGRFQTWTRIRVNLQDVPEGQRPPQEALDPDEISSRTRPRARPPR